MKAMAMGMHNQGRGEVLPVPLDGAVLAMLRGLDGEEGHFFAELVGVYLADAPGLMALLRRAMATDDERLASIAIHSLKGSSSNIGAVGLVALLAMAEAQGPAGLLAALGALEPAIEREFGRVCAALLRELRR